MGVDSLMAPLTNGRIICSNTPMRKIPNLFHNGRLNLRVAAFNSAIQVGFVSLFLFCFAAFSGNEAAAWSPDVCLTSQFTQRAAQLAFIHFFLNYQIGTADVSSIFAPSTKLLEQKKKIKN